MAFGLWTRAAVQQLIEQKYGVVLSVKQVGRYLKAGAIHRKSLSAKHLNRNPSR
ncbi:MAG: winged helix-turn-helix domain-containing protein [Sphingobacteriales bacterium]|nr:winged helix-turn-helix domain-containing protein [Sphingobacteriales bacterium]